MQRTMFYGAKPHLFEKAKELRKNMTPEEQKLWDRLRKKQLGVRFRAQHPIERFIVDFYCHQLKLVIEVDGDIHNFQKEYDLGRNIEIEKYGIKVLRFKNSQIERHIDKVINTICEEMRKE
ncbi:MAG: endonuclease domain-containing protein [Bacteroidales bacterium]|nr:endonuclease domain-containing protein [Bacteroidales bacterium]MCF8338439.1 endonuclease domain-containing protein [Bacteroidales bacterium]